MAIAKIRHLEVGDFASQDAVLRIDQSFLKSRRTGNGYSIDLRRYAWRPAERGFTLYRLGNNHKEVGALKLKIGLSQGPC